MTKYIDLLCKPALHPVAELFVGGYIRMDEAVLPLNPGDAHQNIKAFALPSVADFGHNVPAAPHCVAGIGVPNVTGGQAASNAAIFMFVSMCIQFWARMWGVLALAGSCSSVRQPTCVALLNWRCDGRFKQAATGVTP